MPPHFSREAHAPARAPRPVAPATPRVPDVPVLVEDWVQCARCKMAVADARFARHLTEWCPRLPKKPPRPSPPPPRDRTFSWGDGRDEWERHRHDDIDRLDASLYWGHTFRDNGQFGSMPSFDGYGDEDGS